MGRLEAACIDFQRDSGKYHLWREVEAIEAIDESDDETQCDLHVRWRECSESGWKACTTRVSSHDVQELETYNAFKMHNSIFNALQKHTDKHVKRSEESAAKEKRQTDATSRAKRACNQEVKSRLAVKYQR